LGGFNMSEDIAKVGVKPPHPGSFIRDEILGKLNLSVARAAEVLGVRRATLSDLVTGHAALSPEMALRIEEAFEVSMAWTRCCGCRLGATPTPYGSGRGRSA
jgi:antitoxin HigA-1